MQQTLNLYKIRVHYKMSKQGSWNPHNKLTPINRLQNWNILENKYQKASPPNLLHKMQSLRSAIFILKPIFQHDGLHSTQSPSFCRRNSESAVSIIQVKTWNPKDTCFEWKGPSFGGFKPQNRGQTGSIGMYGKPENASSLNQTLS